jgi:hypothetical protein
MGWLLAAAGAAIYYVLARYCGLRTPWDDWIGRASPWQLAAFMAGMAAAGFILGTLLSLAVQH